MGIKDWKFVFKRRKWSLSTYIEKCKTIYEIQAKFKNAGMTVPSGKELTSAGWGDVPKPKSAVAVEQKKQTKPFRKSHVPKKKQPLTTGESKYDEIVIIETEE